MRDETGDPIEGTSEESYDAPAVEELGSAADLTAGTDGNLSVTDNDDSDRLLKDEVRPLGSSLERLKAIRTL